MQIARRSFLLAAAAAAPAADRRATFQRISSPHSTALVAKNRACALMSHAIDAVTPDLVHACFEIIFSEACIDRRE